MELFDLHQQLVSINSTVGSEAPAVDYLYQYLTKLGWTVERQYVEDGEGGPRENIFAHLGNKNPKLILNSHLDTVPPFIDYQREGDKIRGRGTCDAKGSVAAQIVAVEELRKELGDLSIGLLYVVGEERGGTGMLKANELGLEPEAIIIGEPTENKLALGHKGIVGFKITSQGKAAHSGYPELGQSATDQLVEALWKLKSIKFQEENSRLGKTTINIGILEGGVAQNVIPEHASATIYIRVATDASYIWQTVRDTIGGIQGISLELNTKTDPVTLDVVDGFDVMVAKYNTDFSRWRGPGKKYLLGPGTIHVAHTSEEFVNAAELKEAVELYKKLIKHVIEQ
ncbi:putative peptidase [Basidiobolus meristosporus CBS 931.73]|uniref:Putative peptidase n=1 Tax=Basidiobolus meristosporus CBS 931.73 TaxID=1314790 RepID=A0A1Y1Y3C9_9FUNG|nr:putative peptidase [Basidiobolus meristosporus CBS 931.73]|eukprot:ORX92531.1 putative peptidase [Basidiobolus meristosporus CBS 931.73]